MAEWEEQRIYLRAQGEALELATASAEHESPSLNKCHEDNAKHHHEADSIVECVIHGGSQLPHSLTVANKFEYLETQ